MPKYEYTNVYILDSLEKVDKFCETLKAMKQDAPISLTFQVALTATRDVQFVGDGAEPEKELVELDKTFLKKPERQSRRRRARR